MACKSNQLQEKSENHIWAFELGSGGRDSLIKVMGSDTKVLPRVVELLKMLGLLRKGHDIQYST